MGAIKVQYLRQKPSGYYWEPSRKLKLLGFHQEPLGRDLAAAVRRAEELNASVEDTIRSGEPPPAARAAVGTMARLIDDLLASAEFSDKSLARQAELEYSISIIRPIFGKSRVAKITPRDCETFYTNLRVLGSVHKAARVMKDFRYLLARAMKFDPMIIKNPALAFKVKQPQARRQTWREDQVHQAIRTAWDMGLDGAAVAIAIMYDTSLRPGDVRALTCGHVVAYFDSEGRTRHRIELVQAKTGRPHMAPLWPETFDLIERYKAERGIAWAPTATLIRTRRGLPYTKDRLARDIRGVLRAAGIPDAVQARDLRRTASMERAKGGSTEYEIASSTGHSFAYGSRMRDTYNPLSFDAAERAQDKRRRNKKGSGDGKSLAE